MELKDWVRSAIDHKGITIEKLAEAIGRSKAAVGFWATGATKPSYAQVQRISEITGYAMPESDAELPANDLQKARLQRWPFPRVDRLKLLAVEGAGARSLENALLAAAGDMGIDIRSVRKGKTKRA